MSAPETEETPEAEAPKPTLEVWAAHAQGLLATRYQTFTFPASMGGGDVVLRDLSTLEVLQNIALSASDRAALAVYALRGVRVTDKDNAREKLWLSLSEREIDLITKAVSQAGYVGEPKRVKTSMDGDVVVQRWELPGSLHIDLREMRHGAILGVLSASRVGGVKNAQIALVAASAGQTAETISNLPARYGSAIVRCYQQDHSADTEEERDFFAAATQSTSPPKLI